GAFTITNADSFQDKSLAPGDSITLDVRFDPETSGKGCAADTSGQYIDCQANLSLASSPNMIVTLKGRSKPPRAELRLVEIDPKTLQPFDEKAVPPVIGPGGSEKIPFDEAIVNVETKTKLLALINDGIREAVLNGFGLSDGVAGENPPRN